MNAQRLLTLYERVADAPDAVSRLRRFVLDLAVRGRLVDQDPRDAPACELLAQIVADKKQREVSIRRRRAISTMPVHVDEMLFNVPASWVWAKFGDITISRDGERVPVSKTERQHRAKIYDYYGASGVIDKIDSYLFDKPLLLIGEDGANLINRSTPIAFIARGKYWVNNHAHVVDGLSEEYLRYVELFILAVRGRLVEQNPTDEPAAELLKRVAAEKSRLVKAGEIRKPRDVGPLNPDEFPFPIPRGWAWTQIAQLGIISPHNEAPDDHEASFVPMPMVPAEYGASNTHEARPWGEIKKGYTHFAEGDVGLAKITPCFENGKSIVFRNLTGGIGSGTTELHVVRPLFVNADYIVMFLKSPLSTGLVTALIVVLGIFLKDTLREWLFSRIRSGIQLELDTKLETHKAKLALQNEERKLRLSNDLEVHETFLDTVRLAFSEGQRWSMERKLIAVDKIWYEVLQLRKLTLPKMTFLDIFKEFETDKITELRKSDVGSNFCKRTL